MLMSALFLIATQAANSTPPPPPPPPAQPANAEGQRRVCRTTEITGSRLSVRRICRTEAEWRASERGTQDGVRDAQRDMNPRVQQGPGPGN